MLMAMSVDAATGCSWSICCKQHLLMLAFAALCVSPSEQFAPLTILRGAAPLLSTSGSTRRASNVAPFSIAAMNGDSVRSCVRIKCSCDEWRLGEELCEN